MQRTRYTTDEIGQAMLDQLAGCETQEAFEILAAVMGTFIGAIVHLSGGSPDLATALVDEIAENAKEHVRENWGQVEMARLDG